MITRMVAGVASWILSVEVFYYHLMDTRLGGGNITE